MAEDIDGASSEPESPPPADIASMTPDAPRNDIGALAGAQPRGNDLGSLLDRTLAPTDPAMIEKFTRLKQQQMDTFQRSEAHTNRVMDKDRALIKKAFDAESATIDSTPAWNQGQEAQKYKYDPVEAFGSFASVFAILASAFTRAPMENALNGAAAAMTAMKEGKDQEYSRAFEAWKANTDLAVKRFNMQHTALGDAFKLMETDASRGRESMVAAMTKFGMEKEMLLYQNGMIPEIQQKQASDLKAIEGIIRAKNDMEKMDETRRHNKAMEGRQTADQEFTARWKQEYPEGTAEQYAKAFDDFKQGQKAPASGGIVTRPRQEAQEVATRTKALEAEGKSHDEAYNQAVRESKDRQSTPITGNERLKQEGHIAQYDNALAKIDTVEKVLNKYVGAAGLAGKPTRLGERIGNMFGTNNTDRVQFMRDVEYLQLLAPRLLLDASGRPLSAEAAHIRDIVAGLNIGDTTANTLRAMDELKKLFTKMQGDTRDRLGPRSAAPGGSSAPAAEKGPKWWMDAPLAEP